MTLKAKSCPLDPQDHGPCLGSSFLVAGWPLQLAFGFGTRLEQSHPLTQTNETFVPHPGVFSVSQVWTHLVQKRCSSAENSLGEYLLINSASSEGDALVAG